MVPPTLPEIWKPVTEGYLEHFKNYAAYPTHLNISNNHHLEPPTKQMSLHLSNAKSLPQNEHRILHLRD